MMTKERIVTYEEYGRLMQKLVLKIAGRYTGFKYVYGPPRGGLPIAVHLSHNLSIEYTESIFMSETLVVDDVVDSGDTFIKMNKRRLNEAYCGTYFASLFYKSCSEFPKHKLVYAEEVPADVWVVFPWETT